MTRVAKDDSGQKGGPTFDLDAGLALLLSQREDVEGAAVAAAALGLQLNDEDGAAIAARRHQLHVVVLVADREWLQLVRQQQLLLAVVPAHLYQVIALRKGDIAAKQQGLLHVGHQTNLSDHLSCGGQRSS